MTKANRSKHCCGNIYLCVQFDIVQFELDLYFVTSGSGFERGFSAQVCLSVLDSKYVLAWGQVSLVLVWLGPNQTRPDQLSWLSSSLVWRSGLESIQYMTPTVCEC